MSSCGQKTCPTKRQPDLRARAYLPLSYAVFAGTLVRKTRLNQQSGHNIMIFQLTTAGDVSILLQLEAYNVL